MKIVIAGGTGLIGTALSKALLARRHTVLILTRRSISQPDASSASLRYAQWDGRSAGTWTQHLGGADAVINLTGKSLGSGRWTARLKQELMDSRILPTNLLVETIRTVARRPPLLINQSATGYYGNIPEGILDEQAPPGGDFLASICQAWERSAEAAERFGVRVVHLRTGVVVSREATALKKMVMPFRFFLGGWYGRGTQWFPWIHLHDTVAAILHVLENGSIAGPVNLVAPGSLRVKEFLKMMGSIMGRPAWIPVPSFALRLLFGEMADLLLSGQRVAPRKLLDGGFVFRYPEARNALSQILLAES